MGFGTRDVNHVEAEGNLSLLPYVSHMCCAISSMRAVLWSISFECVPTAMFLNEKMELDSIRGEREQRTSRESQLSGFSVQKRIGPCCFTFVMHLILLTATLGNYPVTSLAKSTTLVQWGQVIDHRITGQLASCFRGN